MDDSKSEDASRTAGARDEKGKNAEDQQHRMPHGEAASGGGTTNNQAAPSADEVPQLGEVDMAILHLVLVQFDTLRVMLLSQWAPNNDLIIETANRYRVAFSRGWSRERHARVYLLQCLDEVEVGVMMLRMFVGKGREKLSGAPVATPFDDMFEVFLSPPLREGFEAAVRQTNFTEADAIRAMYSRAYPLEAKRLTDEQLNQALAHWRRMGGPRKHNKKALKYDFFCTLFEAMGLGPVQPKTLSADWRKWRKIEKPVWMPDVSPPAPNAPPVGATSSP